MALLAMSEHHHGFADGIGVGFSVEVSDPPRTVDGDIGVAGDGERHPCRGSDQYRRLQQA